MLSQVGLVFASCMAIASCSNDFQSEMKPDLLNIQSSNDLEQISATKTQNNLPSKPESLIVAQQTSENITEIRDRKNGVVSSNNYLPSRSSNYMTLRKTGERNNFGNPLYDLQLYADGQKLSSHYTVSGRSNTQNHDQHVSGTEAPLPNRIYRVAQNHVPGTHPEVGGRFLLPIYPEFSTGRSALGIHYDPSFNRSKQDDGTAGCVALTNVEELDAVLDYIRNYQPEFLEVQI